MNTLQIIGLIILGIIFSPLILALGITVALVVLLIIIFTKLYRIITFAWLREKKGDKKSKKNE
jgi:hypothetical protein